LPQTARVTLAIYDLNDRWVRLLEDAEKPAGEHVQVWDGADARKTPVAAGVYIYRLQAGPTALTRKLLLLP
jgi:flagellar hook assembly protein FlgD